MSGPPTPSSSSTRAKIVIFLVFITAVVLLGRVFPLKDYVLALLDRTARLGPWGPVLIGLAYIPATVFLVPGSLLTLGGGFLFGVVRTTAAVSVGSTLGACAAFLVGRSLVRGWVERKVAGNARFAAVSGAVAERGFTIVLLTRLSPLLPFNFLNYAFSLTRVPFPRYTLASWIGMFPGTVLYAHLGAGARSLTEAAAGDAATPPAQRLLFWAGLGVTLMLTIYITRVARRALKQLIDEPGRVDMPGG
ncbi:MAG: hypothetical protein GWP08_06580 [Nitrospiraceae bacterium]|nr:hypothetical protein [Nitrospiraceae bacterium]